MTTLTIYGASDDLIEIEGVITEEFNEIMDEEDESRVLTFSDGSAFRVRYDGCWRITPESLGDGSTYEKKEAVGIDDENYTDRVTLTSMVPLRWVACVDGTKFHRQKA